jgi:hypothetical protein
VTLGVVDPTIGQDYIDLNGDIEVAVTRTDNAEVLRMLEDGVVEDRFYVTRLFDYGIVDAGISTDLLGAPDTVVAGLATETEIVTLSDIAELPTLPWTEEELTGSQFALNLVFDPAGNPNRFGLLLDDVGTFFPDGSGTTQLLGQEFTWSIDADGVLVVDQDTVETIRIRRFEDYGDAFGTLVTATDGGVTLSMYKLAARADATADFSARPPGFLMSASSLTDPKDYTEDGVLVSWFGFNFNDNGRVQRIYRNDFDPLAPGSGWDDMFWNEDIDGLINIESRYEQGAPSVYPWSTCDLPADNCNRFRTRFWQPLSVSSDRVVILEWEVQNNNFNQFPSLPEDNFIRINPRVLFYGGFDIDWDGDGVIDAIDTDDDNDGEPDVSDALPFDFSEQTDFDGDGIGDTAEDSDTDNDRVSNADEGVIGTDPFNPDTDGDGADDGVDIDPLDPGIGAGLALDADILADAYLELSTGALADPAQSLNSVTGARYSFDDLAGTGYVAGGSSGSDFSFFFDGDTLVRNPSNEVAINYPLAQELVDLGVINQATADNFVTNNGNLQIGIERRTVEEAWQMTEDGVVEDVFYVTRSEEIQILDDNFREQL